MNARRKGRAVEKVCAQIWSAAPYAVEVHWYPSAGYSLAFEAKGPDGRVARYTLSLGHRPMARLAQLGEREREEARITDWYARRSAD